MKTILYIFILGLLFSCSEQKKNENTEKTVDNQTEVNDSIYDTDTVKIIEESPPQKRKEKIYCYEIDTGGVHEIISFDLVNDSIKNGYGEGELDSDGVYWSFTFFGHMISEKSAEVQVTFYPEGEKGDIVNETWYIYDDSLRILGNHRGTFGPYFLRKCQ